MGRVPDVHVFGVAVARLLDRHIGEQLGVGAGRRRGALHNRIHLLLRVGAVFEPGVVRSLDLGAAPGSKEDPCLRASGATS